MIWLGRNLTCVTIMLVVAAFAVPNFAQDQQHLLDRQLADVDHFSDESFASESEIFPAGKDYSAVSAVTCTISVNGSKAVPRADQDSQTPGSPPPEPIHGGAGGKIEVFSGVKTNTGYGRDGPLESSTSLTAGEYCYQYVAKPYTLDTMDETEDRLVIKVSGKVIIRCQTMFNASIVAGSWEDEPPHVEIHAGPPRMPPTYLHGVGIPYPSVDHQVVCMLDAPGGNKPVQGGTFIFHTTQFGTILSNLHACGGDGLDGGNGGAGGTIGIFANSGSAGGGIPLDTEGIMGHRANGGNGGDGSTRPIWSGQDGGNGGDGGTITIKAASDPDFPPKSDAQYKYVMNTASATGGQGGHGAHGESGEGGQFNETGSETEENEDGSGKSGIPGGRGGNGGHGGTIRLEGDEISSGWLLVHGGRGGDGGNGGHGGDGANGVPGARGEDGIGGAGGDGGSAGDGAHGVAGGQGGDGGAGGLCLCVGDFVSLMIPPEVNGGAGGNGGRGGNGGTGGRGGKGGTGGSGNPSGDGGDAGPGGHSADGAPGGNGGLGGAAGRSVRRGLEVDRENHSGPDLQGVDDSAPLPGDVVDEGSDGAGGDGGRGGDGGGGGGGGDGGKAGKVDRIPGDHFASVGTGGKAKDGLDGEDADKGGAGLNGGDGGAGGQGGDGGDSWVMAGNGGNGGNGADGGDSRSAQTELNGATDPQAADAQGDCQPGEGGIKGPGGLAGRMHDLSKAPAKAGDPGDDGNSGSVASVETRGSTPTLSEALPCGAKPVVVFIPGFAGSVLKGTGDDGKEVLWPTISPTDMRYFSLSQSGARDVQAVDIIRTVTVGDLVDSDILPLVDLQTDTIYQPLIDFFVNDGFVEFDLEGKPERLTSEYMLTLDPKPTLFPFPYDWRLDNAKNAEKLRWYIDRIRELHPDHDVYIIAHSMGGLIARRCILDNPDGIGKLATMGSPFWGAPVAIYRMLEGEFFGSGAKDILDWVNNDALSKALCTMPGFWQLLPSSTYLANGGLPVIIEDGWDVNEDSYTAGPYTEKQYWDFMDDQAPSTDEPPSDVNREFHSEPQDNWSGDEDQIEYYHVSGNLDEPDTTIGVVAGKTPLTGRTLYIEIKGLGDGTVPLCSAHRFANYRAPDPRTIAIVVTGRYNDVAHMNLPKNDEILSTIMEFFYGLLLLDTAGDYPCVGIWDMGDSQKAPVKAGRE